MIAEWAGLAGIALGALLASAGYIYQLRVDYKKSIRRVLYFLLEIRFNVIAASFDPTEAARKYQEHYLSRLSEKGVDTRNLEVPDNVRMLISSHFQRGVAAARSSLQERLLAQFEEALLQLASVHPVLAYRVLGRDRLEKLIALTKEYGTEVTNLVGAQVQEQWAKELLLAVSSKTQRRALDEVRMILDKDVLKLARRCSHLEYRRCNRAIKDTALQISTEFFAELDPMIDELFTMILQAAAQRKAHAVGPPTTPPAS